MKNRSAKQLIAIVGSAFILAVAYYGSYLPYAKSSSFITAMRLLRDTRTLADFESTIREPLDIPSPVGQEELVRNTGSIVLNIIQSPGAQPNIVKEAVGFLREYFDPIIARKKGMSFGQNAYVLGLIHSAAFDRTHEVGYLQQAQQYYQLGVELGPNRPQSLYGLFGIYRAAGASAPALEIGTKIITLWPTDEKTKAIVEQIKALPPAASSTRTR